MAIAVAVAVAVAVAIAVAVAVAVAIAVAVAVAVAIAIAITEAVAVVAITGRGSIEELVIHRGLHGVRGCGDVVAVCNYNRQVVFLLVALTGGDVDTHVAGTVVGRVVQRGIVLHALAFEVVLFALLIDIDQGENQV
ncbi:hypothetical protein FJD34_01330 [Pseudomonas brenneri]|uniref:Uncharacterized protein n=1 Tax=Pseudomonas brenneri TaxID=129817 RepID=A0A5B2V423_9PSED|nr:hypothetical protein [Pseudomonas brenneri]KAA2233704.1 hypothetical protein F1720_01375 [Pseudomonas brenneri]TWR82062.1 hypothetical protein FJD34_01330 [Pseudomonas brenneri]